MGQQCDEPKAGEVSAVGCSRQCFESGSDFTSLRLSVNNDHRSLGYLCRYPALANIHMTKTETEYANTDLDLKSKFPFDTLHRELASRCLVLHYAGGNDGHYSASFESDHDGESKDSAERDILLIVSALNSLSDVAKTELDKCHLREFNIGFHCGDSFGFVHSIPCLAITAVSDAGCSLAVTLYPGRHPDGTPRM